MIIPITPIVNVAVREANQLRRGLRDKRVANVLTVMSTSLVRGANIVNFWLRSPFFAQAESLMLIQEFCDGALIVKDISKDARIDRAGIYAGGCGRHVNARGKRL
jgi:hypothetical protein